MQVILDSSFARPGSAPIWSGEKGEFRDWTTGRYGLNKLTSLPMCGFIAQLVEHRTGIAEVMGSNPVEALIFSGFFFQLL